MGVFSKVFKGKDAKKNDSNNKTLPQIPQKPTWTDAWSRTVLQPEEVHDLLRCCTLELKARGLDVPFLLLPFRPASDLSATRTFVRNYFGADSLQSNPPKGEELMQELRLTEPLVIAGAMKWCWSRLPGGIVTWEAYELFKIGEHDSNFATDAFATFIPISVGSGARSKIIFDFFEIMSAMAAHGKVNGFSGRKLSRYAAWWAFEFTDGDNGFDGGYKTWSQAADATSHLFFAYLRSLSPNPAATGKSSILGLPRALQYLLETTEYPPVAQQGLQSQTSKVVMIVDTVSPTPFALLRRAKNFHYREEDTVLRHFADFDDPVAALTNECKRVLKSISSANESTTAKHSTSLRDASWSRFEDIGFGALSDDFDDEPDESTLGKRPPQLGGLRSAAASKINDLGRPTTPSWADFMSSGFQEQVPNGHPSHLLPPDKVLPPIGGRNHTSPSEKHDDTSVLEPGELASISFFDLDDTFWWVWMTSLAGEEPPSRKAAFGRCALVETKFGNQWIVMEEIIKGAAPEPEEGAYIAEKKSIFSFSSRGKRLTRSKSSAKGVLPKQENSLNRSRTTIPMSSKTNIAPDQHARIQAAAAALQERNKFQVEQINGSPRRGRHGDDASVKTSSVLTLQPAIMSEAAPALQWASKYDKTAIRAKYLGDSFAGRGSNLSLPSTAAPVDESAKALEATANGTSSPAHEHNAGQSNAVQSVKRTTSVEPRDEMARVPASNPALLSVIKDGPPGSQAQAKKPVPGKTGIPAPVKDTPFIGHGVTTTQVTSGVPASTTAPVPAKQQGVQSTPNLAPNTQKSQIQEVSTPTRTVKDTEVQSQAISTTSEGRPVSPETSRKLQKKPGNTGLKHMFSRKKKDEPIGDITARKPSGNQSAVAAARAALEAKAAQAQKTPEPIKVTSKRFSTVVKKAEPEIASEPFSEPTIDPFQAQPESGNDELPPARTPAAIVPEAAPATQAPIETTHEHQRSQSIIDEEKRAEHEFRSFDQGPMDDVPAFTTVDSPTLGDDDAVRHESILEKDPLPQEQPVHHDQPVAKTEQDHVTMADSPPTTADDGQGEDLEPTISANDRWAQIRKNAADRAAAARPSEEQSRRTDRTTDDDGDTSGEETIESRVARIKARVAELTGNMDLPANRRQ